MPLRRYNRSISVSVSDSVSEGKRNEANSSGAQSYFIILRILPESKNIPAMRTLIAGKVAGAVNKINVEV
jgi:hypothetical protein